MPEFDAYTPTTAAAMVDAATAPLAEHVADLQTVNGQLAAKVSEANATISAVTQARDVGLIRESEASQRIADLRGQIAALQAQKVTTPRVQMVAGFDKPGPDNTGTLPGVKLEDIQPGANGFIDIRGTDPVKGARFWGPVRGAVGTVIDNCAFAGQDPSTLSNIRGGVQNYDPHSAITITNSTFDPGLWFLRGKEASPHSVGFHGGSATVKWCEFVNCADGVNGLGPGALDAALKHKATFEFNWFHRGFYRNGWWGPSDGQNHSDAFQIGTGRGWTLRGNTFGGHRDPSGYLVWPGGYNAAEDFWNSNLMLAQEVDDSETKRIRDVLIEKNFFYGSTSGINHAVKAGRTSGWQNTIIRDNQFGRREADWGHSKSQTKGGAVVEKTGGGFYVIRHSSFAACYSGNVFEGTNELVPIKNG